MKHSNIALFVAHEGCKNRCSFCDQKIISGQINRLTAGDVYAAVEKARENPKLKDAQIAFFGGSFTAIEREYMTELLCAARRCVDSKIITGIRISTRPDCIDDEILTLLKEYKVESIELGAQSMNDEVLRKNRRGHTAWDVRKAAALIKDYGFELGLQMMTGLYKSDNADVLETAQEFIALRPDTVRIYPTVVLSGTYLAELYHNNTYSPQGVDDAAEICAQLIELFFREKIDVIRVGLHSGEGVWDGAIAGAFHPAFKEICESKIYLNKAKEAIKLCASHSGKINLFVNSRSVSPMVGQHRCNLMQLKKLGFDCKILEDNSLGKYEVKGKLNDT